MSRCPSSGIPKHHMPAWSPLSIRTEMSTLKPECFHPRIFPTISSLILKVSRSRLNTRSLQHSSACCLSISGIDTKRCTEPAEV